MFRNSLFFSFCVCVFLLCFSWLGKPAKERRCYCSFYPFCASAAEVRTFHLRQDELQTRLMFVSLCNAELKASKFLIPRAHFHAGAAFMRAGKCRAQLHGWGQLLMSSQRLGTESVKLFPPSNGGWWASQKLQRLFCPSVMNSFCYFSFLSLNAPEGYATCNNELALWWICGTFHWGTELNHFY